jgi:hypothetical protein
MSSRGIGIIKTKYSFLAEALSRIMGNNAPQERKLDD